METVGWLFEPASQRDQGLNDSGENTFSGDLVTGFVREVLQNSLDASRGDGPVTVIFTLDQLEGDSFEALAGAREYVEAGLRSANAKINNQRNMGQTPAHKLREEASFFRHASDLFTKGTVPVLGIHDYGTSGLTGAISNQDNPLENSRWLALTRSAGVSVKQNSGSGGSHGIGHNAPIALSRLNTCFYFSTIDEGAARSSRFQGTMRLRTIRSNYFEDASKSVGQYGYFGRNDATEALPLIDGQIPDWARTLRPDFDKIGTSVIVVQPVEISKQDLWTQIVGATLCNFYLAIRGGRLAVNVGGEYLLDRGTIGSIWDQFISNDKYQSLVRAAEKNNIDLSRIEYVTTAHRPDQSGSWDLGELGDINWYFRSGDEVNHKGIAISRDKGMYISHSLPKLSTRGGTLSRYQPFSLYLALESPEISQVISAMENPSHTDVSLDEVKDPEEQKRIGRLYEHFRTRVFDLLEELIPPVTEEESTLGGLEKFFRLPFGVGNDNKEPSSVRIMVGSTSKKKRKEGLPTEILDDSDSGLTPRQGRESKDYKPSDGDGFDSPDGEGGGQGKKLSGQEVKDLRLVAVPGIPNVRIVHFTPLDSDRKNLVLFRSGQSEVQVVRFRPEKADSWDKSLHIPSIKKSSRCTVRIEFDPEDLKYPIEGRLHP